MAVALLLASACGEEEPAPVVLPITFDTAAVTITTGGDTRRLLVEVARSGEQRSFGLMLRPRLDPGSGMIFQYEAEQPDSAGYWMWRTRIPLDIAFMDRAGTIVKILAMEPCTAVYVQGCPPYPPGVPYWAALEVNQGWFAENGVGEGSVVTVEE
jgi:uncharacterized membrane protein (UPF0127 family)